MAPGRKLKTTRKKAAMRVAVVQKARKK